MTETIRYFLIKIKYLLKFIYGYAAYSDWGFVELRLGNVQRNALANNAATCSWLKLIQPFVRVLKSGMGPVTRAGSCRASWIIFGNKFEKKYPVSSSSMTLKIRNYINSKLLGKISEVSISCCQFLHYCSSRRFFCFESKN